MAIVLKNKNFAFSVLATGISASDTQITVALGDGGIFPPTGSFRAVLFSGTASSPQDDPFREIVTLTRTSGDTFTAVRGVEDTTAVSWGAGSNIAHVFTAGKMAEIETEIAGIPRRIVYMTDFFGTLIKRGSALVVNSTATGFTTEYWGNAKVSSVSSDYQINDLGTHMQNEYVFVDASAGDVNVYLPLVADAVGRAFLVKRADASSAGGTLFVSPHPEDTTTTIDGAVQLALNTPHASAYVVCDGANYFRVGG